MIQKIVDILRISLIIACVRLFKGFILFFLMKEYLIQEISNKSIILRQTKKLKSRLPCLIKDYEGRLVLYADNISRFINNHK